MLLYYSSVFAKRYLLICSLYWLSDKSALVQLICRHQSSSKIIVWAVMLWFGSTIWCTHTHTHIIIYIINSVRSSVCVSVCVCLSVSKLLRNRWADSLQIWWKDASNASECSYLYFVTLTPRSRSPRGQRSNFTFSAISWSVFKLELKIKPGR